MNDRKSTLVIAGAGTGKTRFITNEAAKSSKRTLLLSFTRSAINELKERLGKSADVYTFHSLALKMVSINKPVNIINQNDEEYIIRNILNIPNLPKNEAKTTISYINKCRLLGLELNSRQLIIHIELEKLKESENLFNFTDLLLEAISLPYNSPYEVVLVDEFQDINYLQYLLMKKVSKNAKEIIVVGDPGQTIFSFQGSIGYFEKFKTDFSPKEITLNENYRSTKNIISIVNKISPVKLNSAIGEVGKTVKIMKFRNSGLEAKYIITEIKDKNDCCVLYRAKSITSDIEIRLGIERKRQENIDKFVHFFSLLAEPGNHYLAKRCQEYLNSKQDLFSILRKLESLETKQKIVYLETLLKVEGKELEELTEEEIRFRNYDKKSEPKLKSIHEAKGQQWNTVILMGLEEGTLPHKKALEEGKLNEEKNLLYVALSRAKRELIITHCQMRELSGKVVILSESRFLKAILSES